MVKKKKIYAAVPLDGGDPAVFHDWEECRQFVHGRNVAYRGFVTAEEALAWLEMKGVVVRDFFDVTEINKPIYFEEQRD